MTGSLDSLFPDANFLVQSLSDLVEVIEAEHKALDAKPPSRRGRKPDRVVQKLAQFIAPLYEAITGRPASAYYSEYVGIRTGPFVRVLKAYLDAFGVSRTEGAIGDQVYRLFKNRAK